MFLTVQALRLGQRGDATRRLIARLSESLRAAGVLDVPVLVSLDDERDALVLVGFADRAAADAGHVRLARAALAKACAALGIVARPLELFTERIGTGAASLRLLPTRHLRDGRASPPRVRGPVRRHLDDPDEARPPLDRTRGTRRDGSGAHRVSGRLGFPSWQGDRGRSRRGATRARRPSLRERASPSERCSSSERHGPPRGLTMISRYSHPAIF